MIKTKISVHDLVDFVLRNGDINTSVFNYETMQKGQLIHKIYQKNKGDNYFPEYYLKINYEFQNFDIEIEGRADGLYFDNGKPIIEEIKSTNIDIEKFYNENIEWHLGQAKVYGFMYLFLTKLEKIDINLIYISQVNDDFKVYNFSYNYFDLKQYFEFLLGEYLSFSNLVTLINSKTNDFLKTLEFPHIEYRKYQKELIDDITNCISSRKNMLIEAPTGIGKTISALFPYLKNTEKFHKIFYLTAKESGKEIIINTLKEINGIDANIKVSVITGKEKCCVNDEIICDPKYCKYAKSFYLKENYVLKQLLTSNIPVYDYDEIKKICMNNVICPCQLQFDISSYCKIVICDYNYIFDPFVLFNFKDEIFKDSAILIDECHNLISRVRNSYSSSFNAFSLENCYNKLNIKGIKGLKKFKNDFKNIIELVKEYNCYSGKEIEKDIFKLSSVSDSFIKKLNDFYESYLELRNQFIKNKWNYFESLSVDIERFLAILDIIDDRFAIIYDKNKKEFSIYCLDPSDFIYDKLKKFSSSCLFSATLNPLEYYKKIFYKDDDIFYKDYKSPFSKDNLKIFVNTNYSLLYKDREKSIKEISNYIKNFCNLYNGNYLIFCPSYEYLNKIHDLINSENYELIVQDKNMSNDEKNNFITKLNSKNQKNIVCLAVLGGIFSESLNILNNSLFGVCIIGIGFPQFNVFNKLISNYYEEDGFNYSYVYPGIKNITQAIGRIIRKEDDKGIVLLIDKRYNQKIYKDLLTKISNDISKIEDIKTLNCEFDKFYNKILIADYEKK